MAGVPTFSLFAVVGLLLPALANRADGSSRLGGGSCFGTALGM
ncbi:MAG TPA: hypothetical protein VHC22_25040 [Pirellulales bacterium]|nr:hypothetical protein [Pirellulales bacterium]